MPPVAILVHGAGSTPEAAQRLLGPVVPFYAEAVAVDARGSVDDVVAAVTAAADGREVVVAAGISLGAHALALWALDARPAALALVMPAWTGAPDDVAALTAASARRIRVDGVGPTLAELPDDDWVADELRRAWTSTDPARLAADLAAAAQSAGPTEEQLARLTGRVVVVALADDPLHPEAVARRWADAVPGAALTVVARHAPATDRGALGRAAAAALSGAD